MSASRCAVLLRVALAGILAVPTIGCAAGRLVGLGSGEEARFRHRELGYEIALPGVLGQAGWRTDSLDEADLLVRDRAGSLWALASTCRGSAARLPSLAGELARATGGEPVGPVERVEQAGLRGVSQRLVREEGGARLRIKTVTLRGARCTYDWILIAPDAERFAEQEAGFDLWWASFEPGPTERAPDGSSEAPR